MANHRRPINFGKYADKNLIEILATDPEYIIEINSLQKILVPNYIYQDAIKAIEIKNCKSNNNE